MVDKSITKSQMRTKAVAAGVALYGSIFLDFVALIAINSSPILSIVLLAISFVALVYFFYLRFQMNGWKKDPELRVLYEEWQLEQKEVRNQLRQTKTLAVKYDVGLEHLNLSGSYAISSDKSGLLLRKAIGKETLTIPWIDLLEVEAGSEADLRNRVTLSRVLLTGIFAFGLKKERKKGFFLSVATPTSVGLFEISTAGRDNRANEKKARIFAAACNARIRSINPQPIISANLNSTTSYEEIAKLGELLDKGYLTKEEFETKKKQILNI